ncbi:efflux RND transporter periplasmic adaptor subunit [Sphingomonas changnyeongensis]|uniref:Efflux RND transporter periplasmic adaptor subunit n=1 Tax=Sphingomonas changnyeongensis TaxID=2698679 RepID=A0A7Z2S4E5_9SPHN|nr:efflux RND transporter periplasmic adaptor subunit [Sphingomonas changnyeongensis]QHL89985.1 efflux RND transporter periplasmic adaptor subunit [Sphingomonas changnyeongensis]
MNYETNVLSQDVGQQLIDTGARRRRALIVGIAVVLVAVIGAYLLFGRGGDTASAPAKGGKAEAPHVSVIVPARQPVARTVSATGQLAARREMPVGVVGEGGMVQRVLVEPGDWVAAGAVLAVIERAVQAQQNESLAAQVGVAEADARLADNELERARQLVARGFISQADVDRRTATRDAALARVRVARAQLAEARARTGRLDIRAPAAGLVLTRAVEPGQVVGAGSGVLFRIAAGGQMELRAQLAESDLAGLRPGVRATVTPVGSTRSFTGEVWQVSPIIDPNTRQGTARIALAYDPALRPGGFAQTDVLTGNIEAPVLPESAVLSDNSGNFVYIVDGANKVARRAVRTGQVGDNGIAIIDGLNGTERVVLSAGAFINPGETVVPERVNPARR